PALLGVAAPLVTAIGVAFLYGPEQDPGLELTLGTPTSPRLILLCRLALVFGYTFALALAVTLLLLLMRAAPFSLVISVWLVPMLLLAGLSLLASVTLGAWAGVGSAVGVVLMPLLTATLDASGSRVHNGAWQIGALWRTTPTIL